MFLIGTDLDERNMSPLHFNIEDKLSEAAVSRGIGRGIAESIYKWKEKKVCIM